MAKKKTSRSVMSPGRATAGSSPAKAKKKAKARAKAPAKSSRAQAAKAAKAAKKSTKSFAKSPAKTAARKSAPAATPTRAPGGESVLIVAGEHSGDLLGGDLVQSLRRLRGGDYFGIGGEHMGGAGVELLHPVEIMNVIGFVEAIKAYPQLKQVARGLVEQVLQRGTRVAILIDAPGFNLRLAEMLKKHDVTVINLVSPQIWAWKYGRIKKIRRCVDFMLTLFPFEKDIYDRENVRAECIGHPMIHRIPRELAQDEPIPAQKKKTVALMPGSRGSEITRLLPVMLDAAHRLKERYPSIRFLLPMINPKLNDFVAEQVAAHPDLGVKVFEGRALRVIEASDIVVLSSGTATLEVAWFQKPMVILYRMGIVNFVLASLMLRVPWVGLVNLLAERQICLELLQSEVTAENIEREAVRMLEDADYRQHMIEGLELVRKRMGRGNPPANAARMIDEYLRERQGSLKR